MMPTEIVNPNNNPAVTLYQNAGAAAGGYSLVAANDGVARQYLNAAMNSLRIAGGGVLNRDPATPFVVNQAYSVYFNRNGAGVLVSVRLNQAGSLTYVNFR